MAIEKYMEPHGQASLIFDPSPSYDFTWYFSLNNLFNLSIKTEGKKTLFHEFFQKTFEEPLTKIFKSDIVSKMPMAMISCPNDNKIGRKLVYSRYHFFGGILGLVCQNIDTYGISTEEFKQKQALLHAKIGENTSDLNAAVAEVFKEKARRIKDVLDNEFKSEYFEAANQDYLPFKDEIDFRKYFKRLYNAIINIQEGLLNLGDFFNQPIDYNKLFECFDPDVFYLMFAKIIYEYNLQTEKDTGSLDSSAIYLYHYNDIVNSYVKENRKYDPKITFTLGDGKRIHYSRWIFKDEFNKMQERHPELKPFELPKLTGENAEKYKDITIMNKLYDLYMDEGVQLNWEFLPQDVRIRKSEVERKNLIKRSNRHKDRETLLQEVDERIEIMENSGYIRRIKGTNSFQGYIAYVYSTGAVILEKFWEDEDSLKPAKEEATYIMNIDNFKEMSKQPKTVLIEYMRTIDNLGIERKFHTSINGWHRNIIKAISSPSYKIEDVIKFIDNLMNEESRKNE